MDFGVIHEISDYEAWQKPDNGGHEFPPECENPVYVLATEKNRAMCIWHAPSAEVLQTALDQHFPHGVVNHVFPIDVQRMPRSE